jgi:protein-L-isoaspartate(D-aspartate) O-methyltransferase
MMDSDSARQQMVGQQVRTWDVFDEDVLEAMSGVAREHYVPDAFRHCAYADAEIPLPHGQYMLRPSLAGRILQAVDLRAGDRVLEIGTGTGYLTSCIARLAGSVVSIDLYDDFVRGARSALDRDGVNNVTLHCMDATAELPDGDFDVIIVTASMPAVDPRFVDALKPGGRLFVVVGDAPAMTAMLAERQDGGETTTDALFETDIPALVAPSRPPEFSF